MQAGEECQEENHTHRQLYRRKRADPKGVKAEIYTRHPDAQLRLDIKRHNSQYAAIPVHSLAQSHDRFLLIDNDVYHVGASIKDLGKRWFAIMKMQETKADQIIGQILHERS